MTPALVGIPIKPFGVAKARLAPLLDRQSRSHLGRAIAARTAATVAASGARPVIVTGDPGVDRWARRHGWDAVAESAGGGLNGAAHAVVATASGDRWAVLHADLPILASTELEEVWRMPGMVLAPSRDGGTSLIVGNGPFAFRYGPSSFHRHAAAHPEAVIVCRRGLALDLDTPADLRLAAALPPGRWLRSHVALQGGVR